MLSLLIQIGISLSVAFFLTQRGFPGIEALSFDWAQKTMLEPRNPSVAEVVHIDPSTIQALNGFPNATQLKLALEELLSFRPEGIVVDIPLTEIKGTPVEINDLDLWASQQTNIHFVLRKTSLPGDKEATRPAPPFSKIRLAAAPKTADISNFSRDGVTRRMLLSYQNQPLLHWQLAQKMNKSLRSIADFEGRFSFYDTDQAYIRFSDNKLIPQTSFIKLLEKRLPSNYENQRKAFIILGTDLGVNESEYARTPLDASLTGNTLAQLHGHILNTLVYNQAPKKISALASFLLVLLVSFSSFYFVMNLKPTHGLLAIAGLSFILVTFWWTLFQLTNWVLPISLALLGMLVCYYLGLPFRLILESRKSWEYYQKNKLLKQVEELKSNFISMMSHDLKTPIARIQGMTEVIVSDSSQLSSKQREAVDQIQSSSEDLLNFISSILNYGKVESENIKLHIASKDINAVVKECLIKNEFHAKLKKIQLNLELEPLFPIEMDPHLIQQVVSNLIENAIKYSPEGTQITIATGESKTGIFLKIKDQGHGVPDDELPLIFDKFFRSKNAKSSPVKGTGLGLYLAKYFTELHQGKLFVESTYGQGSVFTLELPLAQGDHHA